MNRKISWSIATALGVFSPAVWALGLGGASVESFLGQSLDVRVDVISDSSEELQSITAGLASADDFELLGLSRSAITVPLEFELVTSAVRPYIHITSDLNVNEPVVQVLVEVVWANGRMLREYTLFLDPPTFESTAPPVVVRPITPVVETSIPVESKAAPAVIDREMPEPVIEEPVPEEPATQELQQTSDQTVEQVVAQESEQPVEQEAEQPVEQETEQPVEQEVELPVEQEVDQPIEQEPEQPVEQESEQLVEQELTSEPDLVAETDESISDDEVYGPVANGETLWGIASEFSRGSGYSVNQAMIALQRKNPEAFIRGNINSLKRGAILRLPARSEMAELTSREALLEALRQQEELQLASRPPVTDFSTPTVADSGDYQESASEPEPEPVDEEDSGHLELVPPENESQDDLLTEQLPEQGASNEAIKEELSRTEEELVNAQQENVYLNQRIQELETEALVQAEKAIAVEDSDLASIESNLAEKRASDKPEPPVAVTPGGETQAWYAGKTGLIAGIAVVLTGLIIWGLRRRSTPMADIDQTEPVQAIADEAEETSPTLDKGEDKSETVVQLKPVKEIEPEPQPEPEPETELEIELETEPETEPEPKTDIEFAPIDEFDDDSEDLEIDDPETKLDLARAYLSLGDKEASRSMLEEVLQGGSEEQKAEARQMMDEIL